VKSQTEQDYGQSPVTAGTVPLSITHSRYTVPRSLNPAVFFQKHQKQHISCHQMDSFKLKMRQNMVD